MERRLYKSRENRALCGVCGGIGEYFGIDPVIVRLLVVVFTLCGGAGLIGYIIGAIIIPEKSEKTPSDTYEETYQGQGGFEPEKHPAEKKSKGSAGLTFGIILIALGGFVIVRGFLPWIPGEIIFAAILIGLGIYFIVNKAK